MAASVDFDEVDDTELVEEDILKVMQEVATLRNCADDLGLALCLSPSFCVKGVDLKAVILEWLKGEVVSPSPACWRTLVKAVAHPVGGKNKALARRIASKHLQKKVSSPVTVSESGQMQQQQQQGGSYPYPVTVTGPKQEEQKTGSHGAKLVYPKQPTPSVTPSVATGATLSSAEDLDSMLSVSTYVVAYDTQKSQDSNLSSSFLVASSVPSTGSQTLPDSSVSSTDPTINEESNPPTLPNQPSETEESDTFHTEEDTTGPMTYDHVQDVSKQDRTLTGDGGGDEKDRPEKDIARHEEEDVSVPTQLRHTKNDSGHENFSAWLESIKQRQRKMKHAEDESPYSTFMKPYPVVSSPRKRGLAIIINIANVIGFPFRSGSKEDEKNLCKLFETLHYNVDVKVDLTSNDIRRLFMQLRHTDCQDHDSFVCCILTHGSLDYFTYQDTILGTDGFPVTVRDLKEPVIANNTLNGKPKLFFIQACRGNQVKLARLVKPDGASDPPTYIDKRQQLRPYYSDVFVGYATTLGMVASRDSHAYQEGDIKGQAGSWYIIELCSVLTSLYKTHDLVSMVTIVHDIMARDSRYLKALDKEKGLWYRQAPQLESTLTRPFFFELETTKSCSSTENTSAPAQAPTCSSEP